MGYEIQLHASHFGNIFELQQCIFSHADMEMEVTDAQGCEKVCRLDPLTTQYPVCTELKDSLPEVLQRHADLQDATSRKWNH